MKFLIALLLVAIITLKTNGAPSTSIQSSPEDTQRFVEELMLVALQDYTTQTNNIVNVDSAGESSQPDQSSLQTPDKSNAELEQRMLPDWPKIGEEMTKSSTPRDDLASETEADSSKTKPEALLEFTQLLEELMSQEQQVTDLISKLQEANTMKSSALAKLQEMLTKKEVIEKQMMPDVLPDRSEVHGKQQEAKKQMMPELLPDRSEGALSDEEAVEEILMQLQDSSQQSDRPTPRRKNAVQEMHLDELQGRSGGLKDKLTQVAAQVHSLLARLQEN